MAATSVAQRQRELRKRKRKDQLRECDKFLQFLRDTSISLTTTCMKMLKHFYTRVLRMHRRPTPKSER